MLDLSDPAIASGGIPSAAWRLQAHLAGPYADWAEQRLASKRAGSLDGSDVAGTEWPLFGSVFYLLSQESLQKSWESDHRLADVAPAVLARRSIEAATNLVTDPEQAHWVKAYWGEGYLHHRNLFYRFLLISAMTSYTNLTGNLRFIEPLRDQVETLSAEIDATPVGLIDDYPGQCFPGDIIAALAAIHRADAVLYTDHTAFLTRARRAFTGKFVDKLGLPPFMSNMDSGFVTESARGSSNAYVLIFGAEIWPDLAADWQKANEEHFWQERDGIVGYREFSKETPTEEMFTDVDSGPSLLNFGFAASAFGVGAARVQGRLDRAGPLMAEMLVSCVPLVNNTLAVPRILSNATDAPYLGEACILYNLTRQPLHGVTQPCTSTLTPFVYVMCIIYFGGWLFCSLPLLELFRLRRKMAKTKSM